MSGVWSSIANWLDRAAIRAACRSVPQTPNSPVGERAPEHLDYFPDLTAEIAVLREEDGRFSFASPFPSVWPENNRVVGRMFEARAKNKRSKGPAVLLLHGWNGEQGYRYLFPLLGRRLQCLGITTAMIELPCHGKRKPRTGSLRNFLSGDLGHIMEMTRQAVGDIRAMLRWLAGEGYGPVGVWGVSLGAWLGGLVCTVERGLGAAVLLTPVSRPKEAIDQLDFCAPVRARLAESSLSTERLDLYARVPKLLPEQILIVEAEHDLFVTVESVEELWRSWGKTEIWRVRQGHISLLFSLTVDRTLRWLANELKNGRNLRSPILKQNH